MPYKVDSFHHRLHKSSQFEETSALTSGNPRARTEHFRSSEAALARAYHNRKRTPADSRVGSAGSKGKSLSWLIYSLQHLWNQY